MTGIELAVMVWEVIRLLVIPLLLFMVKELLTLKTRVDKLEIGAEIQKEQLEVLKGISESIMEQKIDIAILKSKILRNA